jgi:hypothetical protein
MARGAGGNVLRTAGHRSVTEVERKVKCVGTGSVGDGDWDVLTSRKHVRKSKSDLDRTNYRSDATIEELVSEGPATVSLGEGSGS